MHCVYEGRNWKHAMWIAAKVFHSSVGSYIYLIFTYFSASCNHSSPWITALGTSPSQHIVCLNWKVIREKPTNAAKHFKTTFHFPPPPSFLSGFLFFSFSLYASLQRFHLSCSSRKGVFTQAQEEEDKEGGVGVEVGEVQGENGR